MNKKICIISAGVLPIPAVNGGAVENLVQFIIDENETDKLYDITVLSIYNTDAKVKAEQYLTSNFIFIKVHTLIRFIDNAIYKIIAHSFLKNKSLSFRSIISRLQFISKSKKHLYKNDYDCVIAENHHSLFLIMKNRKLSKKYKNNFYYHAHNEPSKDYFCKKEILNCSKIICVSNFVAACYSKRYNIPKEKLFILRNSVSYLFFQNSLTNNQKISLRKELGFISTDKIILYVGRLDPQKGFISLINAFSEIKDNSFKLLIIGSDFFKTPNSNINDSLFARLKPLKDRILFTGFIDYNSIWKYYQIADLGCFPSLCNEAAGMVMIEAYVSNLPMITTNVGGIKEYIPSNYATFIDADENLEKNISKNILSFFDTNNIPKSRDTNILEFTPHEYFKNFSKIINLG